MHNSNLYLKRVSSMEKLSNRVTKRTV